MRKLGAANGPFRRGLRLRLVALSLTWGFGTSVFAQGGPPLVGDDPETPGAGRWELDLAGMMTHRSGESVWELPDVDVNYGWGKNIQLKLDTPYVLASTRGEPVGSGLGPSLFGFKWRFFESQESEFALSMYPQWTTHLVRSSVGRGVADPGSEWFLPIEAVVKVGEYDFDVEVGRRLPGEQQRGWDTGLIVGRDCRPDLECLLELRESWLGHENVSLVNLGSRWKITEPISVLAALGREFGAANAEPQDLLVYLGVQVRIE